MLVVGFSLFSLFVTAIVMKEKTTYQKLEEVELKSISAIEDEMVNLSKNLI
jgi:hypothetical protein